MKNYTVTQNQSLSASTSSIRNSFETAVNDDGMPTFEHFPLRSLSKRGVFDVSEADCKQFIAKMKNQG